MKIKPAIKEAKQPLLKPIFVRHSSMISVSDDEFKKPKTSGVLASSFRYVAREAQNDRRNTYVGLVIIAIAVCLSSFS